MKAKKERMASKTKQRPKSKKAPRRAPQRKKIARGQTGVMATPMDSMMSGESLSC